MFSDKTFCALPFSSIQIHPSGNFKVCCFSGNDGNHGIGTDEDDQVMNIMTHDIEDALNSKLHKEIRLAQSKNERHPCCEVCWARDDAAGHSHRTHQNKTFANYEEAITLEQAPSVMKEDGSVNSVLVGLDIRFGNLCNAKCIHCFPMYSNSWYEDHIRLFKTTTYYAGPKAFKIYSKNGVLKSDMSDNRWWETDRWWQQFDKIKHRLRNIYVTGGEPFLVPAHDIMLDNLIAADLAKNIHLSYDTNLSVINPKILNKLAKFKSVSISASFEDIEDRFELIRYPLKFDKVVQNLKLVKDYGVNITEVSSCLGIYTANAVTRIVPYFQDLGFSKFRLRLLRAPAIYDLKWLPDASKQKLIEKHKNSNLGNINTKMLTGYLENTMGQHNPQMIQAFVKHMDSLDSIRNTNWRAVMPDVVELINV